MPWWGWIVIGAVLLIAEVVIGTDFWLVFFGASALLVGLLGVMGLHIPAWAQWLVFGAASVLALVLFRQRLRDRFGHRQEESPRGGTDLVGETGVALEKLVPGARGRGEIRGSVWQVRNAGTRDLVPGDRFRAESVEGLTLHVRRED